MRTVVAAMLAAGLLMIPPVASAQAPAEPQTKQPGATTAPTKNKGAAVKHTRSKGAVKSKPSKAVHAYMARKRVNGRRMSKMPYAKRQLRRSYAYRSNEGRTKPLRAHGYRSVRSERCR
jgi:hypothetical protein